MVKARSTLGSVLCLGAGDFLKPKHAVPGQRALLTMDFYATDFL